MVIKIGIMLLIPAKCRKKVIILNRGCSLHQLYTNFIFQRFDVNTRPKDACHIGGIYDLANEIIITSTRQVQAIYVKHNVPSFCS